MFATRLTDLGIQKLTAAQAAETAVVFASLALGDGNGAATVPAPAQTQLVNEVWRGAVGSVYVDPEAADQLIVETVLPDAVGGWTIREAGIVDAEGDLVAVASVPDTYKPLVAEGSVRQVVVRLVLVVGDTDTVQLSVNGDLVLATQAYAEDAAAAAANAAVAAHELAGHPASDIAVEDTPGNFAGDTVEAALSELADSVAAEEAARAAADDGLQGAIDAHEASPSAHAASALEFTPASAINATTVQGAIEEVAGRGSRKVFTQPGTFNWTVPTGTTEVFVTAVGAGGGGGRGQEGLAGATLRGGGGGGAGRAIVRERMAVTAGAVLSITVGAGGAGGTSASPNGLSGGNSSFPSLTAHGGDGGLSGGAGGTGGAGASNARSHPSLYGQAGAAGVAATSGGDGGNGGASFFAHGGPGSSFGSGSAGNGGSGGGGSPGGTSAPEVGSGGKGGDGFVLLEW